MVTATSDGTVMRSHVEGDEDMADPALTKEVRGFFERYLKAFDSIDGNRIAALYCVPTVTKRGDGSIHCLQSREELARFFRGVADSYYREGYRSGSFKNLRVIPIGGRSIHGQ